MEASSEREAAQTQSLLAVMRKRTDWAEAVERLRDLSTSRGRGPQQAAAAYAAVYQGCRGAMVFDVVVSRQRKYQSVVLPRVKTWSAKGEPSLERLSLEPVEAADFGLLRTSQ